MSKTVRKLKVIPFYFFFRRLTAVNKVIFALSFAALVTLLVGMWMASENPTRWVTGVNKVYQDAPEEVMVKEIHANYRSMDFSLNANTETVYYIAEPITQQEWMTLAVILAYILGWALILAADTYNKGFTSYLFRGIFFAFFIMSGTSAHLGGGEIIWLVEVGLGVLILFPTVLFRQKVVKVGLAARFLVMFVLLSVPYFLVYKSTGWVGLHGTTVTSYPFFVILLGFIFFIAREPVNIILYFTSNHKKKKYRLKYPYVLGLVFILFMLEFVMLHDAMGWHFIPVTNLGIKPLHLLIVAILFSVFTSQNIYPKVKNGITNAGLSFMILGFLILGTAAIAFHTGTGDFLFRRQIERFVAIIFTTTTLFYFLYVTFNFVELINKQYNYYYLLMVPKRILYFFASAAIVLFSFGLEAADGARSVKLFYTTLYNRMADHAMLEAPNMGSQAKVEERLKEAYRLYETGTNSANGTVKGHYNLAHLNQIVYKNPTLAIEHYGRASKYVHFPYAALNMANIQLATYYPLDARNTLKDSEKRESDPFVGNNLGLLWTAEEQPDSAITALKQALRLAPEESALYANMGNVYFQYGKPEWAAKFLQAGLEVPQPDPSVVTNALALNLKSGVDIALKESLIDQPEIQANENVQLNYSLYLYRQGELEKVRGYLDSLLAKNESQEALLLHGMVLIELGEVDLGLSRFQYLNGAESYRDFRKFANHFLGMAYFQRDVPEMASYYFSQSVENGITSDYYNWATMLLDEGRQDSGFAVLRMARVKDPSLWEVAGKEESMLLRAHGDVFGFLEGSLDNLSADEYVRISKYAGQAGKFPFAMENFRGMITADSTSPTPYLEMGRIFMDYSDQDSAALENMEYGLSLFPDNLALKNEIARAHIRLGNKEKARNILNETLTQSPNNVEGKFLQAKLTLMEGDSVKGLNLLKELHQKRPLRTDIVLLFADALLGQNLSFEAQQLVYDAIQRNHLNKELWLKMALIERVVGREGESGNAALNAINLSFDPEEKLKIAADFAEEIRFLKEQPI